MYDLYQVQKLRYLQITTKYLNSTKKKEFELVY